MSHFVIFHINQFFEPKLQTIWAELLKPQNFPVNISQLSVISLFFFLAER